MLHVGRHFVASSSSGVDFLYNPRFANERCELLKVPFSEFYHRIRINTEGKAKVVTAGWGTFLNAAQTI